MTDAMHDLCRILDERGAEYKLYSDTCAAVGNNAQITEYSPGVFGVMMRRLDAQQAVNAILGPEITEDTSDGWHSFKDLYHHRALLFSVIVRENRDMCWKSKRHHDGTELGWNFIVGINTPWGQASYHYGNEYWDIFDCKVLDKAPYYDGYTADESVARIARLVELDSARDELIYALSECKRYACLCEYCPHGRVGSFEVDQQTTHCAFDLNRLMREAGCDE